MIAFTPVPLEPQPGQVAIRWLGQGGFAFRSPNGITWVVDPYLSDFGRSGPAQRLVPPPVDPATIFCDAVLCTHAHSDHADPVSLGAIAKASPDARVIGRDASIAVGVEAGVATRRLQTVGVGDRAVPVRGHVAVVHVEPSVVLGVPARKRDARLLLLKVPLDRKSTRLNSSHTDISRMPSSA